MAVPLGQVVVVVVLVVDIVTVARPGQLQNLKQEYYDNSVVFCCCYSACTIPFFLCRDVSYDPGVAGTCPPRTPSTDPRDSSIGAGAVVAW